MRLFCLLVCFVIPNCARYYTNEDYFRNFLSREQNDYKRSYYDDYEYSNVNQQPRSKEDESRSSRKRLLNLLSDIVEYSKKNNVIDSSINTPDSAPEISSPQIQEHNLLMPGVAPDKV